MRRSVAHARHRYHARSREQAITVASRRFQRRRFRFAGTAAKALVALGSLEVDAFEHQAELCRLDLHVMLATLRVANTAKGSNLETLVTQDEMLALRALRRTLCS